MADNLPADLVVLYMDAFTHFDSDHDGIIKTKELGDLLRYCGENPSEAEIQVKFVNHDFLIGKFRPKLNLQEAV